MSGGVDSMVMLDLFIKAGFTVSIAHCNFMLRGNDSLLDEQLVRDYCTQRNITFHTRQFETSRLAAELHKSIQVLARELRYGFFDELGRSHGYQYVATAHHINDDLETLIFNLARGTGLDGLKGIPVRNDKVIRPMLFASRTQIFHYAGVNQIPWREDSSNAKEDYSRNFIRHQIVPRLKELNPNLEETFKDTIERLNAAHGLMKQAIEHVRISLVTVRGDLMLLDLKKLRSFQNAESVLWEMMKDYGFNLDQCRQIMASQQTGKAFFSETHRLSLNRDELIIGKLSNDTPDRVEVTDGHHEVLNNSQKLCFRKVKIEDFELIKTDKFAQVDSDKLRFPMIWRPWKQGDHFVPLGMDREKKLSDLLIDAKISIPEKEKVTVLESNGEIIWVVGVRINERYKVTENTRHVTVIECLPRIR